MPWHFEDEDERHDRSRRASQQLAKLEARGEAVEPILPLRNQGMPTTTFWGTAWCQNLEAYSDYANRMPRGRTYLRKGHVRGLILEPGEIFAYVLGSGLYEVFITIDPLPSAAWEQFKQDCASSVQSLLDLLEGKLGPEVLARISDPEMGLFPTPEQIHLTCTCPDHAHLCKHVAATLYAVGVKLDDSPQLFFDLRKIQTEDLRAEAVTQAGKLLDDHGDSRSTQGLAGTDLSELFGIEITDPETAF